MKPERYARKWNVHTVRRPWVLFSSAALCLVTFGTCAFADTPVSLSKNEAAALYGTYEPADETAEAVHGLLRINTKTVSWRGRGDKQLCVVNYAVKAKHYGEQVPGFYVLDGDLSKRLAVLNLEIELENKRCALGIRRIVFGFVIPSSGNVFVNVYGKDGADSKIRFYKDYLIERLEK